MWVCGENPRGLVPVAGALRKTGVHENNTNGLPGHVVDRDLQKQLNDVKTNSSRSPHV